MIYNYTKCESVIAKIMADLNISENNIRITDIREWIFEAVEKIGAPMQYIQEDTVMKLCDGQVPIPCGLHSLDGAAYSENENGPWVPMRSNTSIFKQNHPRHIKCCNTNEDTENTELTKEEAHAVKFFNRAFSGNRIHEDVTYFIKPGWIAVNRRDGYVRVAYTTVAKDERGYPIIPDLLSYQEAIYWYVTMKLSFPNYLKGTLGGKGVNSAQNTFFYIQGQWNFYRNQAYAECMMPTQDELKSIKNDWNKLIPDYDSDTCFFENQGSQQTILNDYYYGY